MHLYRCSRNPKHFSSIPNHCALCDYHTSVDYVNRAQGARLEEFTALRVDGDSRIDVLNLIASLPPKARRPE